MPFRKMACATAQISMVNDLLKLKKWSLIMILHKKYSKGACLAEQAPFFTMLVSRCHNFPDGCQLAREA